HRMGHQVAFVEDSDSYESCYDPERNAMGTDPSFGLAFTAQAFDRLGLPPTWAYFDEHASCWRGPLGERALDWFATADLLLDVSGVNPPRTWWDGVAPRALIQTDPAFTQLRHLPEATPSHTS